jgi:hypothetical protein
LAQQPSNRVAESYLGKTFSARGHFVQSSARAFAPAARPSKLLVRVNDDDSAFDEGTGRSVPWRCRGSRWQDECDSNTNDDEKGESDDDDNDDDDDDVEYVAL